MFKSIRQLLKQISISLNSSRCTFCQKYQETDKTHFGFETVSKNEKFDRIKQVFSNVASSYDLMNDIMSVGLHRFWKYYFIYTMDPMANTKLVDVAGGTGDIAFKFLRFMQLKYPNDNSKVFVTDINTEMLEAGKKKFKDFADYFDINKIEWVKGDAQDLPFEDNSFDVYSIAFGIRNVVDIEKALKESCRVLKPGGMFMCLEFSRVTNPLISGFYDWYSFNIIPIMGELVAKDWKSYQYLVESIRKFPSQEDFAEMIRSSGYKLVEVESLTQGIVAIHIGYKA